jgi:hypothetical protein
MSGDAFTMRNVGALYLLLQLLGIHFAGRNRGLPESLNELRAAYARGLGSSSLGNQASAVNVDCGRKADLSSEYLRRECKFGTLIIEITIFLPVYAEFA